METKQQKNPFPSLATQWSVSKLQAHYCNDTRTVNLALVQCGSYRQIKRSLQELNQLIEIELLTSCFLENLGS